MVVCEQVTVNDSDGDSVGTWLVQYDDVADDVAEHNCTTYLDDCGFELVREPHPVQGPQGEPCISWGDLSDIVAPRDD